MKIRATYCRYQNSADTTKILQIKPKYCRYNQNIADKTKILQIQPQYCRYNQNIRDTNDMLQIPKNIADRTKILLLQPINKVDKKTMKLRRWLDKKPCNLLKKDRWQGSQTTASLEDNHKKGIWNQTTNMNILAAPISLRIRSKKWVPQTRNRNSVPVKIILTRRNLLFWRKSEISG